MINRLNEFRRLGQKNGHEPVDEDQNITPDSIEEERKLLSKILPQAKTIIARLVLMESNNKAIVNIKRKQIAEVRGEKEKQNSEDLNTKVIENQK